MVDALKHMGASVDKDLHSLIAYYGEPSESTDGAKPEDLFALIITFSSALNVRLCSVAAMHYADLMPQKAAVEVLDVQSKIQVDVTPSTSLEEKTPENAGSTAVSLASLIITFQTHWLPALRQAASNTSLFPPTAQNMSLFPPSTSTSQSRATGRQSIGRGDLDQAIRSIRDGGQRRSRPTRPLSKIFLDGGRPASRVFDA